MTEEPQEDEPKLRRRKVIVPKKKKKASSVNNISQLKIGEDDEEVVEKPTQENEPIDWEALTEIVGEKNFWMWVNVVSEHLYGNHLYPATG